MATADLLHLKKTAETLYVNKAKAKAAVKAKVKAGGLDPNKLKNYSVYVIVRRKTTDVVYVGMTKNFKARRRVHYSKRFPEKYYTMLAVATGLSKSNARTLEQALITTYLLEELGNSINSIAQKNIYKFKNEFYDMSLLVESYFDPE